MDNPKEEQQFKIRYEGNSPKDPFGNLFTLEVDGKEHVMCAADLGWRAEAYPDQLAHGFPLSQILDAFYRAREDSVD